MLNGAAPAADEGLPILSRRPRGRMILARLNLLAMAHLACAAVARAGRLAPRRARRGLG